MTPWPFMLALACAAAVAWDARRRNLNPWIWGTLGFLGTIITVISWFAYYHDKTVSPSSDSMFPGMPDADLDEAPEDPDGDADFDDYLPIAVENPGFELVQRRFRGNLDPSVIAELPEACINCGNHPTCYDSIFELREYAFSRCDEYQFDDGLYVSKS